MTHRISRALDAGRFEVDPWQLRETSLDLADLARAESLFALSNGHIGVRGTLDEGDPNGLPGTYLNSFYETRPLPYAEAGYGFPETGQTVLNVTDGKLIRVMIDDEPVDMRYGRMLKHERRLDLRGGVLHREVEWESPAGQRIRLTSSRLVSLTQRSIMAINWRVEPLGGEAHVVVQSELVANEHVPAQSSDPRVAQIMENPLEAVSHFGDGTRAMLMHRTRASQLQMAAGMEHTFELPDGYAHELTVREHHARLTVGTTLHDGEHLGLTKYVGYGWSSQRSEHALRDQVIAALVLAKHLGWERLVEEQRNALDLFWDCADVEIDGAPAVQQATRFAMFHTFQAAARAEQRAIPAKGLTGPGYDGHAFWDTESFVLPLLIATSPHAARDALQWRASTLDLARARASQLHLRGASFPWRTIRGQECSGYWPAGTAAMHVNADIAIAAQRYIDWTADEEWGAEYALPLLVETARLWMAIGYFGRDHKFHIDGVTGPDEYSAIVRDNTYTNLMAARNLAAAADACGRWPDGVADLGVTADEIESWREASIAVAMPYDDELRVHQQDAGSTTREVFDFELAEKEHRYPLLLNVPYFQIYRKQVVKQADLMLAMHWCGDSFEPDDKARAFAYYEPLTVRDSSLSACTQAVVAAEVGHLDLAADHLAEAAMMDLRDLEHNTGDGLHIASLAGAWIAVVAGFGGMRDHGAQLSFRPQLPPGWTRLRFRLVWRDARVTVTVTERDVTYEASHAPADGLTIKHIDEQLRVRDGSPVTRPVTRVVPTTPRPSQPPGRDVIDYRELDA